jgi:hypothetical protein
LRALWSTRIAGERTAPFLLLTDEIYPETSHRRLRRMNLHWAFYSHCYSSNEVQIPTW